MSTANDRAPLLAKQSDVRLYGSTPTEPRYSRPSRRSSDASADAAADLEAGSDGSLTPVNEVSRAGSIKEEEKPPKKFREIWVLCLGLFSASFCSALGATIVANLQIEIGSYFRAGSLASWLGTAYLIGLASMTPLYGRLCGVMGQKRTMLLALWLYILGTTLCAIAPSMTFVLFARAISGAGGGGIMSVTAIIISDLVSTADRGLYQGMVNLMFGTGSACGAVIGGAVADRWGWRMAFYIQIPPLLVSSCLIVWKVNVEHRAGEISGWEKFKRIDWWGSLVLLLSISSLSIGASLTSTSGYPISHPLVSGLFIITLLTLPLFVYIERRAKEPILPLGVLSRTQPRIVFIAFTLTTMTNFSRPVYLHVARGLNGQETGMLLLPGSLFGSACTLYAGWHMRHYKEYKWFSVFVSSVSWMQAVSIMTNWGLDTNTNRLWVEMALGQVGGGTTLTSLLIALISCIEKSEVSMAISAAYLFRAVGQVIGVAIAASIQQSILLSQLAERLSDQPVELIHRIIQEPSTVLPMLDPLVRLQAKMAYLRSVEGVFGFVSCTGICLTLACLLIRPRPL